MYKVAVLLSKHCTLCFRADEPDLSDLDGAAKVDWSKGACGDFTEELPPEMPTPLGKKVTMDGKNFEVAGYMKRADGWRVRLMDQHTKECGIACGSWGIFAQVADLE